MGRKGKKIICYSNSHIIVNLLLSELSKASPSPSFICLACTLEAVTQNSAFCCQLLLQRCEGSSEGQGLHGSWTQRKEFCLNLPQGHREQDRKIVYKSQFSCRSGVVSSAGCLSYILRFYDESASNVSQRCDLYSARHCSTFFVKIIALGHVFMYWPVSPLTLWWKCITPGTWKETIYHKPSYTQALNLSSCHRQLCSRCSDKSSAEHPFLISLLSTVHKTLRVSWEKLRFKVWV